MKKLIILLITVLIIIDVTHASFPLNSINNQTYNQSEIISEFSPFYVITLILSYLISIFWYISKPIPKDVKKRKKFFRNLLYLIFIPVIIVGIIAIYSLQQASFDIPLDDFE
tara:strand:+ start:3165 stop:3500 length:336 start_codon:yes stop_codon:yes gene_type:complete